MAKKDIKFTLDTIDSRYSPVGTVKQLDSVFFYIKITENGVTKDLTGQTIKLFAIKEDKKIVEQTTKINITNQSEGLVEIELLNAAIQVHGFTYFELEISDSNGIISTADFILRVNKRVASNEAIESTNEVATLKKVESYVAKAKVELEEFKKLQSEMLKTNKTINANEEARIEAENRRQQAEESRVESDKQRDEKLEEFGKQAHRHANKKVLDGFTESDGTLFFKGEPLNGEDYEIVTKDIEFNIGKKVLELPKDIVDTDAIVTFEKGTLAMAYENLLVNSDTFEIPNSSFITYWQFYKCRKEILANGSCKAIGTDSNGILKSYLTDYHKCLNDEQIIPKHKYYLKHKKSSDGLNYTLFSRIIEATETGLPAGTVLFNYSIGLDESIYIKDCLMIDLTKMHGEEAEPDLETCNSLYGDLWAVGNSSSSNNNFTLSSYDSVGEPIDELDTSTSKNNLSLVSGGRVELKINDIDPRRITFKNVKHKVSIGEKPSEPNLINDKKIINLHNVDRLLFVGDSYTEGIYYIKGKSWTSLLSEQLDYTCDAYGWGGNTCEQIANRIIANEKRYSSLGYQDLKATKAMLMSFVNDMAQGDQYSHVYQQGMMKLIDTIRRYGAEPIVCTEFRSPWGEGLETGMSAYCNAKGIKFWNILPYTNFLNNKTASDGADERFWAGSHPGSRTGYIILDQYLRYCKTLPRPNSAIKIYRVKPNLSITNLNDLNFTNRRSKLNKFKEIYISHSCLKNPSQWDSLTTNSGIAQPVISEYSKIMNKEGVSFNNYALVEVVLPTTSNNINSAKLVLSDSNISIYIKKNETFELTNNGAIDNITGCMEYDKITFLLKKDGSFIINDIYLEWEGQETLKSVDLNSNTIAKKGIELLSNNKVDNIEWLTKVGTIEPIVPSDNVLPKDCTKCIEVDNNNYIEVTSPSTNIVGAIQNNKLRVVCRYNPPVGDSSINENSYDYRELQIDIYGCNSKGTTRTYYTVKKEVGMYWTIVELEFEANDNRKIQIKSADNTKLEIAYISVLEV